MADHDTGQVAAPVNVKKCDDMERNDTHEQNVSRMLTQVSSLQQRLAALAQAQPPLKLPQATISETANQDDTKMPTLSGNELPVVLHRRPFSSIQASNCAET